MGIDRIEPVAATKAPAVRGESECFPINDGSR
jgi:hypothetical protein